ncbi:hypothetical protein PROFUN_03138 [Planoprotostelium fungivorum]|uniref:Secreted protein n=1 Tax=Planoprotostelium fungivorum TaxID=1890364 RepID=A0A2P6NQC0_9EUKA|nr:hypothetical protein PROFUN_03138 [Planoprotostelium fungivorum]
MRIYTIVLLLLLCVSFSQSQNSRTKRNNHGPSSLITNLYKMKELECKRNNDFRLPKMLSLDDEDGTGTLRCISPLCFESTSKIELEDGEVDRRMITFIECAKREIEVQRKKEAEATK